MLSIQKAGRDKDRGKIFTNKKNADFFCCY